MAFKGNDILTMDELATYLKISKSTLNILVVDNRLPGKKIGRRLRFHKDADDAWVTHGMRVVERGPVE